MDLMKILDDSQCHAIEAVSDLSSILQTTINPATQPLNGVYYIPTILSSIQKDLNELVIYLHRQYLLDPPAELTLERVSKKPFASHILNPEPTVRYLTDEDMIELLFNNLKLISTHPSLLVDHFIPTKLLLADSSCNYVYASGKFHTFNQILLMIENMDMNIVVVGHNIKELDLIEGLIIGKRLEYQRLSGRKLYNYADVVNENGRNKTYAGNATDSPEKKNNNKEDDYIPKSKSTHQTEETNFKNNLYIITTQNLYSFYPDQLRIDLIISFDTFLNENNEHLNYIRMGSPTSKQLIPLIKLIPENSIENVIVNELKAFPDKFNLDSLPKKDILFRYLINRSNNQPQEIQDIGILKNWFINPAGTVWPEPSLPKTSIIVDPEVLKESILSDNLTDLEKNFYEREMDKKKIRLDLDKVNIPKKLTINDYKKKLTELFTSRFNEISNSISQGSKRLISLKLRESIRQKSIEDLNLDIADSYRQLKKLEDEVVGYDKKVERTDLEYQKHQSEMKYKNDRSELLKSIRETEVEELFVEQEKTIQRLEEELSVLEKDYNDITVKSENLRHEYQIDSTEAANLSGKFNAAMEHKKQINIKLNGKAKSLKLLTYSDEKLHYEMILKKVQAENLFLEKFSKKIETLAREKNSYLSIASTGRSGRPSRSNTPYN